MNDILFFSAQSVSALISTEGRPSKKRKVQKEPNNLGEAIPIVRQEIEARGDFSADLPNHTTSNVKLCVEDGLLVVKNTSLQGLSPRPMLSVRVPASVLEEVGLANIAPARLKRAGMVVAGPKLELICDECVRVRISFAVGVFSEMFRVRPPDVVARINAVLLGSEQSVPATTAHFYTAVADKTASLPKEGPIDIPELEATLLPFQRKTLRWLLTKEGVRLDENNRIERRLAVSEEDKRKLREWKKTQEEKKIQEEKEEKTKQEQKEEKKKQEEKEEKKIQEEKEEKKKQEEKEEKKIQEEKEDRIRKGDKKQEEMDGEIHRHNDTHICDQKSDHICEKSDQKSDHICEKSNHICGKSDHIYDGICALLSQFSFGWTFTHSLLYNKYTSAIMTVFHAIDSLLTYPSTHLPAQGLLAEEMGLGKTVEVTSLILLNPRPLEHINERVEVQLREFGNPKEITRAKTTLVIAPDAILKQWVAEIVRMAPSLAVTVYEGIRKYPRMDNNPALIAAYLRKFDVVLTTYSTISREVNFALYSSRNRSTRQRDKGSPPPVSPVVTDELSTYSTLFQLSKPRRPNARSGEDQVETDYEKALQDEVAQCIRHNRVPGIYARATDYESPLMLTEFWRVVLDEVQMVSSQLSQAFQSAALIPRFHAWGVSGTPIKRSLDDLHAILSFLRYQPLCTKSAWEQLVRSQHDFGSLFAHIALRHTKAMVEDDIRLPPQQRVLLTVPFSAVEQDLYNSLLEQCLAAIGLDASGNPVASDWEPTPAVTAYMRHWLSRLRQVCCNPQIGSLNLGRRKYRKSFAYRSRVVEPLQQLKTLEKILGDMLEQAHAEMAAAEAQLVPLYARVGELLEYVYEPQAALTFLHLGATQTENILRRLRIIIAAYEEKGSEEAKVWRQRERSWLVTLHGFYFLLASAYFQHYDEEYVGIAKTRRLKTTIQEDGSGEVMLPGELVKMQKVGEDEERRDEIAELIVGSIANSLPNSSERSEGELKRNSSERSERELRDSSERSERELRDSSERSEGELKRETSEREESMKDSDFPKESKGLDSSESEIGKSGRKELKRETSEREESMKDDFPKESNGDSDLSKIQSSFTDSPSLRSGDSFLLRSGDFSLHSEDFSPRSDKVILSIGNSPPFPPSPSYSSLENRYYQLAEQTRTHLLQTSSEAVKTAVKSRLIDRQENKNHTTDDGTVLLPKTSKKLVSSLPIVDVNVVDNHLFSLLSSLNRQAEVINEWMGELISILCHPLVSTDKDPDGAEYEESINMQNRAAALLHVLGAALQDRTQAVNGVEARHDNVEGDADPLLTVQRKKVQPRTKESLQEMIEGMKDEEGPSREFVILENQKLSLVLLQKELSVHCNSVFNARIEYFKQLQQISDSVKVSPMGFSREELTPAVVMPELLRLDGMARALRTKTDKAVGKFRYLHGLVSENAGAEEWMCSICRSTITIGSLTSCGHKYCKDCLEQWLRSAHSCPMCKSTLSMSMESVYNFTHYKPDIKAHVAETSRDLHHIYKPLPQQTVDEIASVKLHNSYSTKVDMIVKQALCLRSKDPQVQIVCFSQWQDMLYILGTALRKAKVSFLGSYGTHTPQKGAKHDAVEAFKDPSKGVTCFLLNARAQASGLNLINATHIFLCEPLINTSLELQAISRIHRIGQTRKTTVWLFAIENTVEQSIVVASTRKRLRYGGGLSSAESRALMESEGVDRLMGKANQGEVVGENELWGALFER